MAKEKIPYTEPTSSQDELQIKEIVAGTYLKDRVKAIYNNRYGDVKTEYDTKSLYEISEGEVHYKVASLTAQMGYFPEYGESKSPNYQKLTFTPPIGELKFVGAFDVYGKNTINKDDPILSNLQKLENFPFGILAGSLSPMFKISPYHGSFEAVAIGVNTTRVFAEDKTLIGKNFKDVNLTSYPPIGSPDTFYIALLGENLRTIKVLKYPPFVFHEYLMDFYNDNLFLVGIGEFVKTPNNIYSSDLKNNIVVSINGEKYFDKEIPKGDTPFDFKYKITTHRYCLVAFSNSFLIINKANKFITLQIVEDEIEDIILNPVLKTVGVIYKDKEASVYQMYASVLNRIMAKQKINPKNEKYLRHWRGNLDYDYSTRDDLVGDEWTDKKDGFESIERNRGHYLKEIGEYEADYEIGRFTELIGLNLRKSHINNTDDGDIGHYHYLKNRKFKTKMPIKMPNSGEMSYVRMYKDTRHIVFYGATTHRGVLFLFKY